MPSLDLYLKLRLHGVPQSLIVEQTLDPSDCADGNILVPEFSVGKVHDILVCDGIDPALNFSRAGAATSRDNLTANVLGDGGGAIKGQQDGYFKLSLGTLNLGLTDVSTQAHPFADGEMNEIIQAGGVIGHEVDAPQTSVAVAGGEAQEAICQIVLVNKAAKLAALMGGIAHGLVVVANDCLSDESSEEVVRVPADTLDSDSNVGGGHGVITNTDIGANEVSLLPGQDIGFGFGSPAGETGKVLLGKLYQPLVRDATGGSEYHAIGRVVVLDVVGELGAGDVKDVLAGSQDSAAERLLLESSGM